MRRFTQILFPPWVRTYPKSTSAEFFVLARTLKAVKLLKGSTWCYLAMIISSVGDVRHGKKAVQTNMN